MLTVFLAWLAIYSAGLHSPAAVMGNLGGGSLLGAAFDLGRSHEVGPTGLAIGGGERADIHTLHRIGAVIAAVIIILAGSLALRAGLGLLRLLALCGNRWALPISE